MTTIPAQLTPEQFKYAASVWLQKRQRARTDLFFLANEVLSPADSRILVHHAHDSIVDHCQKFTGWKEYADPTKTSKYGMPLIVKADVLTPMWELDGSRQNLLLASRGGLKTTIHTIAHGIQWIINYPDVRILIVTATDEKAQMVIGEMKSHFQYNVIFRFLFPEFCPDSKKVSDWGSKTEFTTPNRKRRAKEPTVMTAAVGKALASTHHDVLKCPDVVTENNIRTDGQIREVIDFFGYLEPLRERGDARCPECRKPIPKDGTCHDFKPADGLPNPGWKDVEGTIYHFSDFHQKTVEEQDKLEVKTWKITRQSCWKDDRKTEPFWPEKFPVSELKRIEKEIGPVLFASQYELNPITATDGLASPEQIKWFDARLVKQLMPRYRVHTTIDLAGMDPNSSGDFTVLTTCGFDQDGRCDVLSILRGHFTDEEFMQRLFAIDQVYPSNIDFKMQADHFSATLKGYLRREQAKRGRFLNITYLPNSGRGSKTYRIIKGLQGWFASGNIRFADTISCRHDLVLEILRFPKGRNDDILDTLADQFSNWQGQPISDIWPDAPRGTWGAPVQQDKFLGFDPITAEQRWLHDAVSGDSGHLHAMTGAF